MNNAAQRDAAPIECSGAFATGCYALVAESTFGDDGSVFRVLVDSTRAPRRVYQPLSLPCYT